jgi:Putative prokaryotic signal transducing protein
MDHPALVEIYRGENSIDAHLKKAVLEAAGIRVRITEEHISALDPNFWWAAPKLLVTEEDVEKSRTVLRDLGVT